MEDVKEGLNITLSYCCNAVSLQMVSGNSICMTSLRTDSTAAATAGGRRRRFVSAEYEPVLNPSSM